MGLLQLLILENSCVTVLFSEAKPREGIIWEEYMPQQAVRRVVPQEERRFTSQQVHAALGFISPGSTVSVKFDENREPHFLGVLWDLHDRDMLVLDDISRAALNEVFARNAWGHHKGRLFSGTIQDAFYKYGGSDRLIRLGGLLETFIVR